MSHDHETCTLTSIELLWQDYTVLCNSMHMYYDRNTCTVVIERVLRPLHVVRLSSSLASSGRLVFEDAKLTKATSF